MTDRIRIAVVDDHPLFREGVMNSLALETDMMVVGEGATAHDAIRLAKNFRPDVIVLDVNLEGNALKAVETISTDHPNVNILMLTMVSSADCMMKAMTLGARGYALKGVSSVELCGIVRKVSRKERYVSPNFTGESCEAIADKYTADIFADLSEREERILTLVSQAFSNKEIAWRISVTEKTVKHYITSILKKLHARNRVEAALLATHRIPPTSSKSDR